MEEKSITPEGIINQAMGMNMSFAGAEFPVEIFPSKIQRIIHEVYECQSYPIDYTAASILTAIAAGIGNTHLVQMKQGWVESAILFVALVGRPGANKSHPLSFAMKPFINFDYQQNLEFGKLYAKYEQDISMSKKRTSGCWCGGVSTRTNPQTLSGFGHYTRRVELYPCTE